MLEPDYGFTAEFARVHPQPIYVPTEVTEELERLDRREDALMNLDEEAWTEELEVEADHPAARREDVQQVASQQTAFSHETRKRPGCTLTPSNGGNFQDYE